MCKHLVRALPVDFDPICGEVHRQHASPILWIASVHHFSTLQPQTLRTFTFDGSAVIEDGDKLLQELRVAQEYTDSLQTRYRELAVEELTDLRFGGLDRDGVRAEDWEMTAVTDDPVAEWLDADVVVPMEEYELIEVVSHEREAGVKTEELRKLLEFLGKWCNALQELISLSDDDPRLRNTPSIDLHYAELWQDWITRM